MKEETTILYKMYLLSQPVRKNIIYTLDWSTLKVVQAGSGCFWKQKKSSDLVSEKLILTI